MTTIGVYGDWDGLPQPTRLGWLHSRKTRAHETFEFRYDPAALSDSRLASLTLDPRIYPFEGPQYLSLIHI